MRRLPEKKPKALREPQWMSSNSQLSLLPTNHTLSGWKSYKHNILRVKTEAAWCVFETCLILFHVSHFNLIQFDAASPLLQICSISEALLFELMANVIKCCLKQDGVVATINQVEDVILVSRLRFLNVANWSLWDMMSLMFPLRKKNGYK